MKQKHLASKDKDAFHTITFVESESVQFCASTCLQKSVTCAKGSHHCHMHYYQLNRFMYIIMHSSDWIEIKLLGFDISEKSDGQHLQVIASSGMNHLVHTFRSQEIRRGAGKGSKLQICGWRQRRLELGAVEAAENEGCNGGEWGPRRA